jgi:8-oxo-dGTP pyrophosphatase MutT (NUDIX family)
MRWTVHGERVVYESPWMNLLLADVEIPGGERFEHHLLRIPRPAAAAVVHDRERGVLLLWRHRFITDRWGWEIPAGAVEPHETPAQAAARETLEETGWRPGPLRPLIAFNPAPGGLDHTFHVFAAEAAEYVGEPEDPSEVERIEWVPLAQVRQRVRAGEVHDGFSLTALLWFLLFEVG